MKKMWWFNILGAISMFRCLIFPVCSNSQKITCRNCNKPVLHMEEATEGLAKIADVKVPLLCSVWGKF